MKPDPKPRKRQTRKALAASPKSDAQMAKLRQAAYQRLAALRGSEPDATDVPRARFDATER